MGELNHLSTGYSPVLLDVYLKVFDIKVQLSYVPYAKQGNAARMRREMPPQSERWLEIFEPVVAYQDTRAVQISPSPRPTNLEGKRVVFIANFKPRSLPFMEVVATTASQQIHLGEAVTKQPTWPFTHADRLKEIEPQVEVLAKTCDAMVTGIGD